MTRRTILIEQVFRRFATPQELKTVDELYSKNAKGVATHLMQRRVVELLTYYIEKYGVPSKVTRNEDIIPSVQQEQKPRFLRINNGGHTTFERMS